MHRWAAIAIILFHVAGVAVLSAPKAGNSGKTICGDILMENRNSTNPENEKQDAIIFHRNEIPMDSARTVEVDDNRVMNFIDGGVEINAPRHLLGFLSINDESIPPEHHPLLILKPS